MTAHASSILFSWHEVDGLPDGEVIEALEERRGHGRNDYPVRALWRALVAGVVFQHGSVAALVRELRRNPALLEVCGFDPRPRQGRPRRWVDEGGVARIVHEGQRYLIPDEWVFSRMRSNPVRLEEDRGLVSAMMEKLRGLLIEALPDYGEYPGADGKAIESHGTGRVDRKSGQRSDKDADWGTHKTRGWTARVEPGSRSRAGSATGCT